MIIDVMEEFALSGVEVWTLCYTRASKATCVILILSDAPSSIAQGDRQRSPFDRTATFYRFR